MKKLIASLCLLIGFASVLVGAGAGVTVIVKNVGAEPLHSVVVHVTGGTYAVGDIGPGESRSATVQAAGESHVELEQAGADRLVVDCYIEKGYKGAVTAEITSKRVVRVTVATRAGLI